jgi:hypothetical protein
MGELCRDCLGAAVVITAVEGCPSAVEALRQRRIYDEVHPSLLQEWIRSNRRAFDLAIFGDVLEHLVRYQALTALDATLGFASHVIVNVPLRNLYQDVEGNALEQHRAYLVESDFDSRYLIREKHLLTPDPGYVYLNLWITGRRRPDPKGALKDWLLRHFGRRGRRMLERFGYDAYPRADVRVECRRP